MKRLDAVPVAAVAATVLAALALPLPCAAEATGEDVSLFQELGLDVSVPGGENASAAAAVPVTAPVPIALSAASLGGGSAAPEDYVQQLNASVSLIADPVDAAAEQQAEQSEEQAFLAIRKQLAKNSEETSTARSKLNQAMQWGRGTEQRLLGQLRTEKERMQRELEAQSRSSNSAVAAARQAEQALEQKLKSESSMLQQQANALAQVRQELAQKDHDFEAAEQAWRSRAAKLQQDQSAEAQASMRWLKAAQHSKDMELNASKLERARLLQAATHQIRHIKEEEEHLRQAAEKEQKDGQEREAALHSQLNAKSRELEESRGQEDQLRRQLSTLQKVARAEIQKLRHAAQHRQGTATRGAGPLLARRPVPREEAAAALPKPQPAPAAVAPPAAAAAALPQPPQALHEESLLAGGLGTADVLEIDVPQE